MQCRWYRVSKCLFSCCSCAQFSPYCLNIECSSFPFLLSNQLFRLNYRDLNCGLNCWCGKENVNETELSAAFSVRHSISLFIFRLIDWMLLSCCANKLYKYWKKCDWTANINAIYSHDESARSRLIFDWIMKLLPSQIGFLP